NDLAYESQSRNSVIRQTLSGAVQSIKPKLTQLAIASRDQVTAIEQLGSDAIQSFNQANNNVALHSADGTLLRGEVLARWQDFVGTGDFMRAIEQNFSWLRDRVTGVFRTSVEVDKVQVAVGAGLEALVVEEGAAACERAETAWRSSPAGRYLLERNPGLSQVSDGFNEKVTRQIRGWQQDVLELVSDQGQARRSKARLLAFGTNGLGVALMIVIFASTGGLTGAEIGVAGGTSVLAQRLLEVVFGENAIRDLAKEAKEKLDARIKAVFDAELARYQKAIDDVDIAFESADRIESALSTISDAAIAKLFTAGVETEPKITTDIAISDEPAR
ncbi:MAG: ABC transporter, partial [Actinomycetales bacterium]